MSVYYNLYTQTQNQTMIFQISKSAEYGETKQTNIWTGTIRKGCMTYTHYIKV